MVQRQLITAALALVFAYFWTQFVTHRSSPGGTLQRVGVDGSSQETDSGMVGVREGEEHPDDPHLGGFGDDDEFVDGADF